MAHSEFLHWFFLLVPALMALLTLARAFPPDKSHGNGKEPSSKKEPRRRERHG